MDQISIMILWSLLMIIYVLSKENLKDFETIYLNQYESTVLNLHDYFSQNEINFYITSTNMTNDDAILKHDSSLNLLLFMPTKSSKNTKKHNKTFPVFNIKEGAFFIWYENNQIFAYLFTNNNALIDLWKLEINNNIITQAVIFKNHHGFTIALATKICENIKHNHCLNEIYLIRVREFMEPEKPRKLNLWDIKYVNDLKISGTLTEDFIMVYGRFKSGKQILFFYELIYPESYFLVYSFDHYIESGEFKNAELNLIDVQFYHDQLFLLDHELGLFIYSCYFKFFEIRYQNFYDFRNYGKSYSIEISITHQTHFVPLIISTDVGIIFALPRTLNSEFSWVNTYDSFNALLPFHSMEICNNKLFLQVEVNKSHYLMTYDYDKILSENIEQNIANFNLESHVGDDFDPTGLWIVISNNNDYFYIRNDGNKIKVFSLVVKDWSLEIVGNNSFYIEITGKSNNKNKKPVKKYLNVICFESGSYEIYESTQTYELIENGIDIYFKHSKEEVEIKLDSLVYGPNLTYSIESYNFSDYASVELYMPNVKKLIKTIIFPRNIKSLKVSFDLFIYMIENNIYFKDLVENKTQILSFEVNIIKFIWIFLARILITFGTDENLQYKISGYKINKDVSEFNSIFNTQIDINCLFFKADYKQSFILCADHEVIYIYCLENLLLYAKINKENLNLLDNLWIQDAELVYNYDTLSFNKMRLFVACNYGIILIEFSGIIGKTDITYSYKVFNNFPKNIQRILLIDDNIFLIFSDNKIGLYDISLKFFKILGPHYKESIENIYVTQKSLILQVGNQIALYDWHMFSHNALMYTFIIDNTCKLISYEGIYEYGWLYILCQNDSQSILNFYEPGCGHEYFENYYGCSFPISINFTINQNNPKPNELEEGEISIIAKNPLFKRLISIKVNLHISQNQMWIDSSKFPKIMEIPYSKEEVIILSSVFHGENIQASMLINNINYENIDTNYSPAYFRQNFNEIYSKTIPYDYKFSHQTFIANKLITTGLNEFIIYNYNNYTLSIDSILSYSNYINGRNIGCRDIDGIQLNENIILIFSICDYLFPIEFFWNEHSKISSREIASLLAIEYDSNQRTSNKSVLIEKILDDLKIKSIKLNDNRFEIFLYENKQTLKMFASNFIFRYKGVWDRDLFKIEKKEKINYYSLGNHWFSIRSLDIIISEFSEIFLYIVDRKYELIVIKVQENLPAEIIVKVNNYSSSHFLSLCHCEKTLLIFSGYNDVFKFSIKNPYNPIFIKVMHFNSLRTAANSIRHKFVAWTDDCSFIAYISSYLDPIMPLKIWNYEEYFEITKYKIDSNTDIIFLEKNIIALTVEQGSKIIICLLNNRFIDIPALSKEKFKKIEKKWGTNEFQIQLYAENLKETVFSEVMILKRGNPEIISPVSWWLWICIGVIIFILAASICCVIFIRKKNKKETHNYTELGLMMEEINSKK